MDALTRCMQSGPALALLKVSLAVTLFFCLALVWRGSVGCTHLLAACGPVWLSHLSAALLSFGLSFPFVLYLCHMRCSNDRPLVDLLLRRSPCRGGMGEAP